MLVVPSDSHIQAVLEFPTVYPFMPPRMRFTSPIFHHNVYEVCPYINVMLIYQGSYLIFGLRTLTVLPQSDAALNRYFHD